ncbi:hypothetical protein N0V83_010210 [Neocucurbitaria cava]|uniref:Uncharacterized protein n=1 Tax=Neocucurbitaria cava TaxID=798079 RepID=A0A9W8XZE3_9PLEO|nr:hypothetical protein N0V83_010210 [Neocucurbitaria cava]
MHEFHKNIVEIKNQFMAVRKILEEFKDIDGKVIKKLEAIEKEGENLKISFLAKLIDECYKKGYPRLPTHIEIQPDLWDAACDLLKESRQAVPVYTPQTKDGLGYPEGPQVGLQGQLRTRTEPPIPDEELGAARIRSPNCINRYNTVGIEDGLGERDVWDSKNSRSEQEMPSPKYQVVLHVYNIDKTKLTKTTRPTIYTEVDVANKVALEWLKDFFCEDEVVRVRDKELGMKEYAAQNVKNNQVAAWAEVVKVADEA